MRYRRYPTTPSEAPAEGGPVNEIRSDQDPVPFEPYGQSRPGGSQRGIERLTSAKFSENHLLQLLPDPGCSEEEGWAGPLHVAA